MTIHHPAGRLVDIGGRRLWVEEEGAGEPLLLLSGGPASSHAILHPAFSALADRYRVIYVDYYGRGKSDRPESWSDITFAQDVADIDALIRALDLGPVHLYGFSYGGMVAQGMALEHPESLRSLVLANTLHSPEMWQRNHDNINRELELQHPEVWAQIVELHDQGVVTTDPRLRALYRAHGPLIRFFDAAKAALLPTEPGSFNEALYPVFVGEDIEFTIGGEVAKLPDFRPRLKDLKMPTLILAGRFDRALYPAMQLDFQRCAPQAEFVWMERSGSFSHLEEPEPVMALLRRFLDRSTTSNS